jgi:hypothetical protein
MIWLRFKAIGKVFDNMDQIRDLKEEDIKKILINLLKKEAERESD